MLGWERLYSDLLSHFCDNQDMAYQQDTSDTKLSFDVENHDNVDNSVNLGSLHAFLDKFYTNFPELFFMENLWLARISSAYI